MLYSIEITNLLYSNGAETSPYEARLLREATEIWQHTPVTLIHRKFYLLDFEDTAQNLEPVVEKAAASLFIDPVIETAKVGSALETLVAARPSDPNTLVILTVYRPGVTDAVGESALRGYNIVTAHNEGENSNLRKVRSADIYYITTEKPLSADQITAFARRALINDLVQDFVAYTAELFSYEGLAHFIDQQFNFTNEAQGQVRLIPLRDASDELLERISKEGLLALDLNEMKAIQAYYQQQDRDPTDVELETLAQTWSEHCVHKTFKARIDYHEYDHEGTEVNTRQIDSHLKNLLSRQLTN